jgi:hypothetical protein
MEFVGWPNTKCRWENYECIDPLDITCWWYVTDRVRHTGESFVAIGVGGYRETASITDGRANQYSAIRKNLLILGFLRETDRECTRSDALPTPDMGNFTRPVLSAE